MDMKTELNVFLVDDDPSSLALYELHLKSLGYQNVWKFDNGMDCINSLSIKPDVIFLDYRMPGMDGVEVLKVIKQRSPDIYVVFVTGDTDAKTAATSLKYGAFDFIQKGSHCTERIESAIRRIVDVKTVLSKKHMTIEQSTIYL